MPLAIARGAVELMAGAFVVAFAEAGRGVKHTQHTRTTLVRNAPFALRRGIHPLFALCFLTTMFAAVQRLGHPEPHLRRFFALETVWEAAGVISAEFGQSTLEFWTPATCTGMVDTTQHACLPCHHTVGAAALVLVTVNGRHRARAGGQPALAARCLAVFFSHSSCQIPRQTLEPMLLVDGVDADLLVELGQDEATPRLSTLRQVLLRRHAFQPSTLPQWPKLLQQV